MKRIISFIPILALAVMNASASTVVESWEGTLDGWTVASGWSSQGTVTTNGVTQGSYSWRLSESAADGGNPVAYSTASTALTSMLINAASLSFDVKSIGTASFGGYLYFDIEVQQIGGDLSGYTGSNTSPGNQYASLSAYAFTQHATLNSEYTVTYAMPALLASELGANPSLATSIYISAWAGKTGTSVMYLDNLTVTSVPEPGTLMLLGGMGGLFGLILRRRQ